MKFLLVLCRISPLFLSHLRNLKQAKNVGEYNTQNQQQERHLMNVNEPLRKLARMMCKEAKAPKQIPTQADAFCKIPYND